jgi:amidophosphoribosyltransferase
MARDAGATKVYFASAAPPVRFPNVYGIDMPSRDELLATGRSDEEICKEIGADALIYQDLDALVDDIKQSNPKIKDFDCSCFDGKYVTGDISEAYLSKIESARGDGQKNAKPANSSTQLDLNLINANGLEVEEGA